MTRNCSIYTTLRPTEEFSHPVAIIFVIVAILVNPVFFFAAVFFFVFFVIFFIRLFSMPQGDG